MPVDDTATCFEPYRPDGWTAARAPANLDAKLADPQLLRDLDALVSARPDGYDVDDAADVARAVIAAAR